MIVRRITIEKYNITIVLLLNYDYKDKDCIQDYLIGIDCSKDIIDKIEYTINTGFTYTRNTDSIIGISKTSSYDEYINTSSHEIYHMILYITKSIDIDTEDCAILLGNLTMYMSLLYNR